MPPVPGVPASQSMAAAVLGFIVGAGGLLAAGLFLWLWLARARYQGRRAGRKRGGAR